jgi:uncharacterized protein (DUF2267 family)
MEVDMTSGLAVFDTTVQESNTWRSMIDARLPPCSRQEAYGAFRAVVHTLRDRLPLEAVLSLSAQLPLLLRGIFFEGWRPADAAFDIHDAEAFGEAVARRLPPGFSRHGKDAAQAVFSAFDRLDSGETAKLARHLPLAMRRLFPIEHRAD